MSKKQKKCKPVKGWAVIGLDTDEIAEVYICDLPEYAKRRYMNWKNTDGPRTEMLAKWNESYAKWRKVAPVIIAECPPVKLVPRNPRPRKRRKANG